MSSAGLHPVSGDGVLARAGSLVLLCSAGAPSVVDAVLATLGDTARSGGDGTALVDGVSAALDGSSVSAVVFGPVGRSVLVAVFGHAWADVATEHGEQRLALRGSGDGVRIVLPGTLLSIKAGLGDVNADAQHQQWGNLEHGSVHAAGLVYIPSDAAEPAPAAASTPVLQKSAPVEPAVPEPAAAPEPEPEPQPEPEPEPQPEPVPAEPAVAFAEETTPYPPEPATEPEPEEVAQPETEVYAIPDPAAFAEPEPAPPAPEAAPPAPEPAPAAPAPAPSASDLMAAMVAPARPEPAPAPPAAEPAEAPAEPAHAPAEPELVMPPPSSPAMPRVTAPSIPEVDRSQPFSSVSLIAGAGALTEVQPRAPLPVAAPMPEPAPEAAPPPHPVEDFGVQVLGVYCKNGHFDDPAARYCAVCGISMAQLTLVPRLGPRPPLGVLVLDDGSIFTLQTDYVVGRDPSRDERVLAGTARPLRLDDPQGLISRAHFQIHLEGWQVQVIDLGSANGTGVFAPGDSAWQATPRLTPVTIRPGTQIGFGQRQLRFESHTNT